MKLAGIAGLSALLAQSATGCAVAGNEYDAVIIGAGVVGCCTARELSRYSASVLVCEAGLDIASGATRANSGIVHAGFDPKPATLKARYNVAGAKAFPRWHEELGFTYFQNGAIVLAFNDGELKTLQTLLEQGKANGVDEVRVIGADELRELEPNVSPEAIGALYAPTSAVVDPYGLSLAALENAIDNGVELALSCKVTDISKTAQGYAVALNDERTITCRSIVNAAGIHSDELNNLVSKNRIAIQPKRGEYVLYQPHSPFNCTVFQAPSENGKGVLVGSTVFGNCFIGPNNVAQTSKSDVSTTKDGLRDIIAKAKRSWSGASSDSVISTFAGLRASNLSGGDFVIGEVEDSPGFFNAACIDSPGLASAPAIASDLAALVAARLELNDNPSFNPIRTATPLFAYADDKTKQKLLAGNPDYGITVCKCYGVTKAEIINALLGKVPVCALDALKWRCGATMGPCQGGRCFASVVDIVARELNVNAWSIAKRERDSKISLGAVSDSIAHSVDASFNDNVIEKPRASYLIPGSRPAGIYSARTAVQLIANEKLLPGENVAVWGETDWANRAVQALEACGAAITRIEGDEQIIEVTGAARIESVTIGRNGLTRKLFCDTLIISRDLVDAS